MNNILITEDGYSKLSDDYFEEIRKKYDDRGDIFCLGCICIELYTGIKNNNNEQLWELMFNLFNQMYKKNKCSKDFIFF